MNPLQLLPAKARATVAIVAMIITATVPILIDELPGLTNQAEPWVVVLKVLAAAAAIFAGTTWISNLTPDNKNPILLARIEKTEASVSIET